jgi:hypothetical protein
MTDKEVMQMALDIMESAIKAGDWVVDGACDPDFVLNALRAALAQPKREWQGLTDEEQVEIQMLKWWDWEDTFDLDGYTRAIEAKLKEKNA